MESQSGSLFGQCAINSIVHKLDADEPLLKDLTSALFEVLLNKFPSEESPLSHDNALLDLFSSCDKMSGIGLAIDWLQVICPETVSVDVASKQVVFNRSSTGSRNWQLSLLSSAIHRSRWSTLQDCIKWLLSNSVTKYEINSD